MTDETKFQRELIELMVKYISLGVQRKTVIFLCMKVARGLPLLMDLAGDEE